MAANAAGMRFELIDVPDDLPPGEYGTRIVSWDWFGTSVLRYVGPYNPDDPTLISFTKHYETTAKTE
jgi:hypothetical protein